MLMPAHVHTGVSDQIVHGENGTIMVATNDVSQTTNHASSPVVTWVAIAIAGLAIAVFAVICAARDAGYGGPHHDEVIALMASKGFEREYVTLETAGDTPFHRIVPASDWHRFTRDFASIPFSEVRDDVLFGDRHPPLAFWVLNQWLALFPHGQYAQAVVLVTMQIVIAAALLMLAVLQFTGSGRLSLMALIVFLAGNSAVFTATWVRQYALFAICYALTGIFAAELTRGNLTRMRQCAAVTGLGVASMLGMMTQYTFVTMSGPIHLALVVFLIKRRLWDRMAIVGTGYLAAASTFFVLIPGAIHHAQVVSQGLDRQWQVGAAFWGVPQMIIPMPSVLEGWIGSSIGLIVLVAVLALGARVCIDRYPEVPLNRPDPRVVLAGMLGAGVLQFVMVAVGFFPGWATSPPHLCALWWLTVLALSIWMSRQKSRLVPLFTTLAVAGMIGMQLLYARHCRHLLPLVNSSYIASQRPQLVCLDNLARGYVLQLTEVMSSDQPVLATDGPSLRRRLLDGDFQSYDRVLYMPMNDSVARDKPATIEAARSAGFLVRELPVVFPLLYNAILFEKGKSTSVRTRDYRTVPP
jgi:hypothetical protein